MKDKATYKNMREYTRVDVMISFTAKVIPREFRDKVRPTILSRGSFFESPKRELNDPLLSEWLRFLNKKLDYIISFLLLQQEGFTNMKTEEVNISGSGMSFPCDFPCNKGDIVEIKAFLKLPHPVPVVLYGEVVRCEENRVAVKFINMSASMKDFIIKFVLYSQAKKIGQHLK